MLLNIRLQIFVDLSFSWRAAFYVASEVSGTVADTKFASLSTVALSDTYFFVEFFEEAFLFQHIKCRNQVAVAGAAGFYFFYCICHIDYFSSFCNVMFCCFSKDLDVCF